VTTTAAAAGTRRHTGTYPGEPRQVGIARAALAGWLGGGPRADEAILVASEFATNSVLHSSSREGGAFILRAEVGQARLRIEVEDGGGPWHDGPREDGRPHGLDVVTAIAGRGTGASAGATVGVSPGPGSAGEMRMTVLPPPGDAERVGCCLADHPQWSACWDKRHGLWRVTEDDPDSDLYAESSDVDTVISYITEHSIVDR
jgi:anti-sigma regulatory factor (Ser/Thr protein kinase)